MAPKKSYLNAFEKASKTSYFYDWRTAPGVTEESCLTAVNPFSGVKVLLDPLEATIYDFCVQWYSRYEEGADTECPVSTYDNMRYYLLYLNQDAYMDLLD